MQTQCAEFDKNQGKQYTCGRSRTIFKVLMLQLWTLLCYALPSLERQGSCATGGRHATRKPKLGRLASRSKRYNIKDARLLQQSTANKGILPLN